MQPRFVQFTSAVTQHHTRSESHVVLAGGDLATEVLEATLANSNATVQKLQEQAQMTQAAHSIDVGALNEQLAAANASLATKQATIRYCFQHSLRPACGTAVQAVSYAVPSLLCCLASCYAVTGHAVLC